MTRDPSQQWPHYYPDEPETEPEPEYTDEDETPEENR
jgi:hypothetical protein